MIANDHLTLEHETIIIVPARAGSKRVPGKNLRVLGGMPLLEWTDQAVKQSGLKIPCILTTDDEEIAEVGRSLGWTVPFLRPVELASDSATTFDAVVHVLDWWRLKRGVDPEHVMVLQVTSPFRGGATLNIGMERLKNDNTANAIVGVHQIPPRIQFTLGADGYLASKGQLLLDSHNLVPNGAFYLIRSLVLREQKTFFPTKTLPLLMDAESSIDIDTNFDWSIAEMIAGKRLSNFKE